VAEFETGLCPLIAIKLLFLKSCVKRFNVKVSYAEVVNIKEIRNLFHNELP
jgi:hypothetical protein